MPAAIGSVLPTEQAVEAAALRLVEAGIESSTIHVGAEQQPRAAELAQRHGLVADVSPDDPFRGFGRYTGADAARRVVDRSGVAGAAVGAVIGLAIGFSPAGAAIPVAANLQPLANALFYFVAGLFVGSVLGASLAPQQSVHAGFRLIDGMQEGRFALIIAAPAEKAQEVTHILETCGATGITQV